MFPGTERPAPSGTGSPAESPWGQRRPWAKQQPPALVPWNARIAGIYDLLQSTDAPPTPQAAQAAEKILREATELFARARKALAAQE